MTVRLSELIANLSPERLSELARTVVPGGDELSPKVWSHKLELVLSQTGYVEQVVFAHRPPVASVLLCLLEAEDHVLDVDEIEVAAARETALWCERVTAGDLGHRVADRSLLYRKMLEAAWSNDHALDPSEVRMLRLLREQLGLFRIEHFLLAHHASIQPYWRSEDEYLQAMNALLDAGVIFGADERRVALPRELVPNVRRALGVELPRDAARRLLSRLDSGTHLKSALGDHDLPTSGSRQDRIDRIIEHFVPMHRVVDTMHIADARELVRSLDLAVSGSKEELVDRIVDHFANQRDLVEAETEAKEGDAREPRELDRDAFASLFEGLKGHQLHTLLMALELRTSGTKEIRIATLWESPFSETTLLSKLKGPELEDLLARNELGARGSKAEKVARLIAAFRGTQREQLPAESGEEEPPASVAPAADAGPTLSEGISQALADVELSSKSMTRFDPVREFLSTRLEIPEDGVGVKYLADAKNHRNRIGEALHKHPKFLVLLAPEAEVAMVLEASVSRMAVSPGTCFAVYCASGSDAIWVCRGLLSSTESALALLVSELEPEVELRLAEVGDAVEHEHIAELLRDARLELDAEWLLTDAPLEMRIRRALHRAFHRSDAVIRTKHISEGRNIGNRISEAVGAGCSALLLVVPDEIVAAATAEASRQLVGLTEPMMAIVVGEHESGGYSRPVIVTADGAAPADA